MTRINGKAVEALLSEHHNTTVIHCARCREPRVLSCQKCGAQATSAHRCMTGFADASGWYGASVENCILHAVLEAMQAAEELGGPEEEGYIRLMKDIESDAKARRETVEARLVAERRPVEKLWAVEFGADYEVPDVIQNTLVDWSWHNDLCPSFVVDENDGSEGENVVRLWVNHPDPAEREESTMKRFLVAYDEGDSIFESETDVQGAIEALLKATAAFKESK